MDFELKTSNRARLCSEKCDALIVLMPDNSAIDDDTDALSQMAAVAIKSGDLETKPGKLLGSYRAAGLAATRLVWVGCGDGSAKNVRVAVVAAMNTLKNSNAKRVVLSFCAVKSPVNDVVRTAVVASGDAAYAYTTTKSKPTPSKLASVVLAVPDAANAKPAFDKGVALVNGISLAKEWANRPANHATPVLLAAAAKALGKFPKINLNVVFLREVVIR